MQNSKDEFERFKSKVNEFLKLYAKSKQENMRQEKNIFNLNRIETLKSRQYDNIGYGILNHSTLYTTLNYLYDKKIKDLEAQTRSKAKWTKSGKKPTKIYP